MKQPVENVGLGTSSPFEKSIFRYHTRLTFILSLCADAFSDVLTLEYPQYYSFSVTSD